MNNIYKSIDRNYNGEYKAKGSKFIGDVFPVKSIEDVKYNLEYIRMSHPKARHHCWAYKLGIPPVDIRSNDDNEPSGTAGKPILGQLDAFNVTNVLAVVTRYFGGTLLGTGGLIKAYKEATREALILSELIDVKPVFSIKVSFDHMMMHKVMNAARRFPGEIVDKDLNKEPYIILETESNALDHEITNLVSRVLEIEYDHAASLKHYGFKIEKL